MGIQKWGGRMTGLGLMAMALASPALAQDAAPVAAAAAEAAPKLDSGDTAWMLTSTALVLM
ncbi:MAG: hypothetical protein JWO51_3102, partial [Rhodospirillales bacterium]|nr:hypothetical protein [Rhodospirillales bacterium]